MLLLNINRKPYVGSPMASSDLILSELEGKIQGHQNFEALYLAKEPS